MRKWFRWLLVLLVSGLLLGIAFLAWYYFAADGRAEVMFYVSPQTRPSLFEEQPIDETAYKRRCASQMAALKSYHVLNVALALPGISRIAPMGIPNVDSAEDSALAWLAEGLSVSFPQNGEYMKIELRLPGVSPNDTRKVLDAVVQAYEDEVVNAELRGLQSQKEVLDRAYIKLSEGLNRRRESYLKLTSDLKKSTGPNDLYDQLLVEKIKLYERECLDLTRRLNDALAKKGMAVNVTVELQKSLQANSRAEEPDLSQIEKVLEDPELILNHGRIVLLKREIAAMTEELVARNEQSPELQIMKEEIDLLQTIVEKVQQARETLVLDMSNPPSIQKMHDAYWVEKSKWNEDDYVD